MMTYEEREAAVWGELDAAEDLVAEMPDDERAQECLAAAQARVRAFTSDCPACRALAMTCLRCRNLPASPPERNGNRCVCGARLHQRVGGWGCSNCGSAFMEETHAKR